jgi:biotin carboxylase
MTLPSVAARRRVLLLATTTGYQTRMFEEAAAALGIELVYATDRCDQLADPWRDGAIAIRFHDEQRSIDAIRAALASNPVHGILVAGDRPTVMAAALAEELGLRGHPREAAAIARDKRLLRERLAASGFLVPRFLSVPADSDPSSLLPHVTFPVVIKPTVLSGSRGVIRADDPAGFVAAFARVQRLLATADVRELRDPGAGVIQVESYIPGAEFAVEAVLDDGVLRTLAIFDKPDPLDGPFFEETIYVTPTRAGVPASEHIAAVVARAAAAIGLEHGPVHAECRVNDRGVHVLEIAARPIGGLCGKVLRFERAGEVIGLEQLLLRHALGEPLAGWARQAGGAAVMMIPIPRSGVYRRTEGVEAARRVAGVEDVRITAKPDQQLLALPEGASYLGFIFAHAASPAAAEAAVRAAHACLRVTIDPAIHVSQA